MATSVDASGNSPFGMAHRDLPVDYNINLQSIEFKGARHVVTLGAASVSVGPFGPQCRAIRIAPEGNCHYRIGNASVAAAKGEAQFIADGAIEYPRVQAGQYIAFIQDASETDQVTVTEDR